MAPVLIPKGDNMFFKASMFRREKRGRKGGRDKEVNRPLIW